jgi:hypothetical protein
MDGDRGRWVLLVYRLPREPSTPRIAVWRKLRRLGAVQLIDGLVALPLDSRTREQLEWLADEVIEAGGEASVWLAEPDTARQTRELATRMSAAVASQYREIEAAAEAAREGSAVARGRAVRRLRGELRRTEQRDYFRAAERADARRAVEALRETLEVLAR